MVYSLNRKSFHIHGTFAGCLLSMYGIYFQFFRLICIKIRHCFRFIKEYYLSIYFHKAYLVCIRHFFCLSSKPVIIGKHQLFHHFLHLIIKCFHFYCKSFHLVLKIKKHLYKKCLIYAIQFFLCILNLHNHILLFMALSIAEIVLFRHLWHLSDSSL